MRTSLKGAQQEVDEEPEEKSCIFPCTPCFCCPDIACIPGTWQRIQDFTHFVLVLGLVSCIAVIIHSVLFLYNNYADVENQPIATVRSICVLLFALPVSTYCSKVIGQFDEQLQTKQKEVAKQKENLLQCYKGLLTDMDTLLSKSTESASGLAERSFESKRRDFARFLDRAKTRFSTGIIQTPEMVSQFRKFCLNWLQVFKECSIDPVDNPKTVVTDDELEACTSIGDVATCVAERLLVTEVKFISEQRHQDTEALKDRKNVLNNMSGKKGKHMIAITDGRTGALAAQGSQTSLSVAPVGATKPGQITWLKCESGCSLCKPSPNPDGCPREFGCGCFQVTILSKQHMSLMFSFLLGCIVIGLSVFLLLEYIALEDDTKQAFEISVIVLMAFAEITLVLVLLKFEQLDVVERMEREVKDLKLQNEQVEEQRTHMRDFWNKAQQLTELWLYRTVPRLDLAKELHSQLEDTSTDEELLQHMTKANQGLEDIDARLGSLEDWRGGGHIAIENKKAFGKVINELVQEPDPERLVEMIQDVVRGKEMKALRV